MPGIFFAFKGKTMDKQKWVPLSDDPDVDFKASVLAAAFIENGRSPFDLVIWPAGGGIRNFSKEVIGLEKWQPSDGTPEYLCIRTSREGIYDMLPEGLFHQPDPYSAATSTDSIIDSIRRHKQEEREARLFFLPFEAEINFLRTLSELHEYRMDKRSTYADFVRLFLPQWDILEYMELWQANIFLQLIPFLHSARGDLSFLGKLLELILRVPATAGARPQPHPASAHGTGLGEQRLGVDLVAGDRFNEGTDEVLIRLGPLTSAQINNLLPGTTRDILLNRLISYCVPAGFDVCVELNLLPEDRSFRLGPEAQGSGSPVLSYTAYL